MSRNISTFFLFCAAFWLWAATASAVTILTEGATRPKPMQVFFVVPLCDSRIVPPEGER